MRDGVKFGSTLEGFLFIPLRDIGHDMSIVCIAGSSPGAGFLLDELRTTEGGLVWKQ
jgi:hypothetical protein